MYPHSSRNYEYQQAGAVSRANQPLTGEECRERVRAEVVTAAVVIVEGEGERTAGHGNAGGNCIRIDLPRKSILR